MNKFDKLFKSIIKEATGNELKEPTEEDLTKFLEINEIPSDNEYMNLNVGDFVEEFGGNSGKGWGQNSGNAYSIINVVFPGYYELNSVPIKNEGTDEEQKWVIDSDRLGDKDWVKSFAFISKDRKTGEICLHKFSGFINDIMNFYDNGFKKIDDIDAFLSNKKVDMSFNPYNK